VNKNILLAIGAVLVLALAAVGGYLFLQSNQPTATNPTSNTSDVNSESDSETLSMSMLDLIRLGQNYQCNYTTADETGNQTTGTIFVAGQGQKMQGDFTVSLADQAPMTSHLIHDGEYNYIWSDGQAQGIKMKIDPENEALFPEQGEESENQIDETTPVDFDCRRWNVDESKFVPPATVTFVNFSAQLEGFMAPSATGNDSSSAQDKCGVCDQVPAGAARDQCLQAMGC
jgi:hypothetical protein